MWYLYIEDMAGGFIGPFSTPEIAWSYAAREYPDHYEHRPRGAGYICEVVSDWVRGSEVFTFDSVTAPSA